MKQLTTLFLFVIVTLTGLSQNNVGINTIPDSSAVLDISATDKGLLIPRMTEAEMNAIAAPATSLMVFNTTANAFWYWDGNGWTEFVSGTSLWTLSGTAIDVADTNYKVGIGTSNPSGKFEVATVNHTGSYGSDVATGGAATASEEYPGQPASLAFDNTPTTYWSNNNNLPAWIGYDLGAGNEKRVARYSIAYNSVVTNDNSPNDWTFEASDDAVSWTVLDTQTGQGWTATGVKTYDFSNTTHYRYYRLNISDNKGTINDFVSVYEMEMKEETLTSQSTFSVSENGAIRISDGNEADGKILVSDVSGNANWADGATVNGGGWSINGNLLSTNFDSVGIGTTTPGAELEVVGHISQTGTGASVFLGESAGVNDDLTDNQNVFIGLKAGEHNTFGEDNVAIGTMALKSSSGSGNTAIGSNTLNQNILGYYNTAVGFYALLSNTSGVKNEAFGDHSLFLNKSGNNNCAIGAVSLLNNATGSNNIAVGGRAMYSNYSGSNNVAIGSFALTSFNGSNTVAIGDSALLNNGPTGSLPSEGVQNTAVGSKSLISNTKGSYNTALGYQSLYSNIDGNKNTAIGDSALYSNANGNNNTASGNGSLFSNSTGNNNTASGVASLFSNTIGDYNSAYGNQSLYSNINGSRNTALGDSALFSNTAGNRNTASGGNSLFSNSDGNKNSATGYEALYSNTSGDNNVAFGYRALFTNNNGIQNVGIGSKSLYSNASGEKNIALGYSSLFSNTIGSSNISIGAFALYNNTDKNNQIAIGDSALFSNTTGNRNTAIGYKSLLSNTEGLRNTATGNKTLFSNTSGDDNTAIGFESLYSNSAGIQGVAMGTYALYSNTTGDNNTAIGYKSLYSNTGGGNNAVLGFRSLYSNTSGGSNIAIGTDALYSNTDRSNLVAIGDSALYNNGVGASSSLEAKKNVAIGSKALYQNTMGYDNTAIGYQALYNNSGADGYQNTAVGSQALFSNTGGAYNTAIGQHAFYSSTLYSYSTALGYNAAITASYMVKVGDNFTTWIGGGVGWSITSDGRFKRDIKEDVAGLDFILKLRPVTYTLDITALDRFVGASETEGGKHTKQEQRVRTGFIAQEVEKAARDLNFDFDAVHHPENENDPYTLSYAGFVVPLVKAVQELAAQNTQLVKDTEGQQKMIAGQNKTIEKLKQDNNRLQARMDKIEKRINEMEK